MRYRLFGQTGLRVSEILLGTMGLGEDARQCRRVVDAYADAGGNVLDTASAYGNGEAVLGEVVERRDRFVIATKYTLSRDAKDPNAAGNHRKNLVLSLEQSLKRLRTDYIDIYWVHLWDRHTPVEETMRALDDVIRAGKVLYIGISDAPAWVIARANTLAEWRGWTPFAGLQVPYNLLKRDIERELLPMAEGLGMSVATWAPLAGGVLSGGSKRVDPKTLTERDHAATRAVRKVADELGATPAQVALAWLRSKSTKVLPLVGVSSVEQLTENLAELTLPGELIEQLEGAVEFELGFPADFIAECEPHPFAFGDAATKVDGR
ncbi:aryl-alcohol dehydrogenase-like predicted oxidoreductase [Kibdelosporangium banguiense]|uniref:Aryl-alcohol dehydrogenase-like predicted oxidoreductase n=1 Tax=Kibdelosporangium banguiense TaxID=1365924 RepID=A0ABS4TIL5_9PSEU|nr:aldo/keto reductase [Kibdelosporangium banguiense]MBP2323723.1 aryl-alcohol dehydrogenase-like predicted oxidoreductase [Kibdelosporangium banguiense]